MQLKLTLISYILSIWLSFVYSFNKYTAKIFQNDYSTEELKELVVTKGEFTPIILRFEPDTPIEQTNLDQLLGTLQPSKPFVLSDVMEIDTFKARYVLVYVGLPCSTELTATTYDLTFTLKIAEDQTSDNVKFGTVKATVSSEKAVMKFTVEADSIPGESYGIYTIDAFTNFNVDPVVIKVDKTEGLPDTKFNSLTVPPYNKFRRLMYLKGTYEAPDVSAIETEIKEQKGSVTIEGNACYEPEHKEMKFTINRRGLAEVGDAIKQEIVRRVLFKKRGLENNINDIEMKIEINTYPVFLSCGIQPEIKDDEELLAKLKNMNDHVQEMNENLFMIQRFVNSEGLHTVYFQDLSRWATGFTALCTLEDTYTLTKEVKSIRLKFGNVPGADKKVNIVNEDPQSAGCAIWSFKQTFPTMKEFGDKAIYACKQHFAKINIDNGRNTLDSNGCIQCDSNPNIDGTTQKGICIRNTINCPTNFNTDLQTAFGTFITNLDTKEKIKQQLGIETSEVEIVDHQRDDSFIEADAVKTKFISTDEIKLKVNTENTLTHTITCMIKNKALHSSLSIVDDLFFQTDVLQKIIKPNEKIEYELDYADFGYDNKTYNVFFKCYNLNYEGKFYHSQPFLSLTMLKTDKVPVIDPEVEKNNCKTNPFHVECINYVNHEPLNMLNYQIIPPYKQEINDFKRLDYEFQNIMIDDEFKEMALIQQKGTLVDKTIYLGHILGYRNCQQARDYKKCRELKTHYITILVNLFQKMYDSCDRLVDDIRHTSTGNTPKDIVLFVLALFQLGNNADSYTKDTYQFLFNITDCVIQKANILREMIFNYSEDYENADKSIIDFVQLLITHSANVIDIVRYLEMDGIIKADPNTNIFNDYYVNLHHKDYEQVMTLLMATTRTSIIFDNVHYIYFKKDDYITDDDNIEELTPSGSDPKMIRFEGPNMKITMQPRDLFILTNASFISIFVYDHYPFLSINTTTCSPNAVGLKFYKANETLDISEIEVTSIPKSSYPVVQYNFFSQNKTFQQGLYYDLNKTEFITDNTHFDKYLKNEVTYGKVYLHRSGDFTLGYRDVSSWLWLIITGAVVGAILLGVGGYFIFYCIKKKKSDSSDTVDDSALIKEDV